MWARRARKTEAVAERRAAEADSDASSASDSEEEDGGADMRAPAVSERVARRAGLLAGLRSAAAGRAAVLGRCWAEECCARGKGGRRRNSGPGWKAGEEKACGLKWREGKRRSFSILNPFSNSNTPDEFKFKFESNQPKICTSMKCNN